MREMISNIRSPLIDNYTRIIQSLAKRGRTTYHNYLIEPLSSWVSLMPAEPMGKLLTMLEKAESSNSKKIPLLYKMTIIKSVAPDQLDMSLPGNISIDFLKSMKDTPKILTSDEALEFVNLLKNPFKEYSDNEFIRMNKQFEKEINNAETIEVEKLIKIREGREAEIKKNDELSDKALSDIKKILKNNNISELKRAIIVYLLKFSDPSMPNRHLAVNDIIDRLARKNSSFKKEVMDSTAVITYHEILKAIKYSNLSTALKYISKYAVLFRGNPDTPNYREVDSFEKNFFK